MPDLPTFLTPDDPWLLAQLIVSGLLTGAVYGLIALGVTLIFGVMRVINFAHGDLVIVAMYAVIYLNTQHGLDPYVAALIVTPVFFGVGALLYLGILGPLMKRGADHTNQVVATLGVAIIAVNAVTLIEGAQSRVVTTSYSTESIVIDRIFMGKANLFAAATALGVTMLLLFLLRYTYTGMAIRATSQDRQAATLMGISAHRINMLTFGLGTAAAAIAAASLAPFFIVNPSVGLSISLVAYVVVVLGGLGSLAGAFLGGLIIGVIESLSGFYFNPELKEIAYLLVFVLVLILRPSGLLGTRGYEAIRD